MDHNLKLNVVTEYIPLRGPAVRDDWVLVIDEDGTERLEVKGSPADPGRLDADGES